LDSLTFRRDRWLRTSASHLATWSLAGLVLEFRFRAVGGGGEGAAAAAVVVIVGVSLLNSSTHGRRAAKMVGPAGEPSYAGAGQMWTMVIGALALGSGALLAAGRPEYVTTIWLFGVGCAFALWGRKADFLWYFGLGSAMVAAAAFDAALAATGGPVGPFRFFVLGLALPAAALLTNRRFLWFRPEG
jgi:hypothetical protein